MRQHYESPALSPTVCISISWWLIASSVNYLPPFTQQAEIAYVPSTHRAFQKHTNWVMSLAFSPDGKFALSGSIDNSLILWDVESRRALRTLIRHTDRVPSVAFSPDGKTALSASLDNSLILWDVESGQALHTFVGFAASMTSVVFSPDGKTALSGSCGKQDVRLRCTQGEIVLWDLANGQAYTTFVADTPPSSLGNDIGDINSNNGDKYSQENQPSSDCVDALQHPPSPCNP
jgi:WD40 repeat protein